MTAKKSCFIAMPITTNDDEARVYGDDNHWRHVMEALFVPAIQAIGYEPVRPVAKGASMIHAEIVKNLESCDLVLCDLSSHNPNVFFELGVRTSLDLPISLVRDNQTRIPFDLGGINAHEYDSSLRGWELEDQRSVLADHLDHSVASCKGSNPLWQTFGLTIRAQETDPQASPVEAGISTLARELTLLRDEIRANDHLRLSAEPKSASVAEVVLPEGVLRMIAHTAETALTRESPLHGSRVKRLIVEMIGEDGYRAFVSNDQLNVVLSRLGVPVTTDDSGRFFLSAQVETIAMDAPVAHAEPAEWERDLLRTNGNLGGDE